MIGFMADADLNESIVGGCRRLEPAIDFLSEPADVGGNYEAFERMTLVNAVVYPLAAHTPANAIMPGIVKQNAGLEVFRGKLLCDTLSFL